MFKNTRIRTKIFLAFMIIGVLSVGITGWLVYKNAKSSLKKSHFNQLTAIRETKKRQIEAYFNLIKNQIITLSEDKMIIDAMGQFKEAFLNIKANDISPGEVKKYVSSMKQYYQDEFLPRLNKNTKNNGTVEQYWPDDEHDPSHGVYFQYHYIANNPYPTGSKDNLDFADDGSEYSKVHARYHPTIRNYLKKFGYYDILLVDAETGHIVYSVFKEMDFATNLMVGSYSNTNLAEAYRQSRNASDKEFTRLYDFGPYGPSYAAPASFIASPIFDGEEKIGVLVFQVPTDEINRVMTGNHNWKEEGLGDSGETYLVGADYTMRSDSRFIIEGPDRYLALLKKIGTSKETIELIKEYGTSILLQDVRTEAVEDAMNGNKGTKITKDYRGIDVLSSYTPLNINDVQWVMLSEIDKDEVFLSIYELRNRIIIILIIVFLLVIIIGFILTVTISKAESQLESSLREKVVLLKEVHHRVKNNLQVVSSLLNLQSNHVADEKLLDVFRACQNRVKSMSQVHEELYKTKDLANIEFAEYARKLTVSLMRSYTTNPDKILLELDIDNIFLGVDMAIPCGLVLNEFFSNSLKYAFPSDHTQDMHEGKRGKVYIGFKLDNNRYELVYSDNGVGLPKDIDFKNTKTLGLELVNLLTQQLGGTIELNRSKGTEFKITFEAD